MGSPLQGSLCGETATITLHTADAFGNVCTLGTREKVEFLYRPKSATKAEPVRLALPRICHHYRETIRGH